VHLPWHNGSESWWPGTAALRRLSRSISVSHAWPKAIGGELAILTAWLVIPFGVALKIFRWQ
jgi:hypothetical protein